MEVLHWLWTDWLAHARSLFAAGGPYGAPAMLGALVFTMLYYADRRWRRGRKLNLRAFTRSIFTQRIILHPSSLVDMRMWALNALVFASAYGLFTISALACRDGTVAFMTKAIGAHEPTAWPVWAVMGIATLLELLAYEFGYWFSHYLFHRIPSLWEFHKVHHSAEVMTTFTEMRQHPVEIIFFMNVIAFFTGSVFGLMTYTFGPGVGRFTLLNGNVVLMFFLLTWGHLRHSHIWIAFRGLGGRLFQSPAHHQIHHSTNPVHFDKNLGFALAVWDWAFGTLHIPSVEREVTEYGVGENREDYLTVTRSFIRPFARASEHLTAAPEPSVNAPRSGA